ncbi:beta strand repeat-containing protein [Luteolibacter luteus]|uniref:Uncharacterized protein n=1 Tax=Luteolibacter luteus TaxID=2728835 RepID=A0A858RM87_9BACT|nr:hypothetical protein [Luteolibacter luteus]QJE97300.1 hypothetical protein HHL09_16400 [Luteolibacter luteus]
MKPTVFHSRRNLLETALGLGCVLASTASVSQAASLYWDGTNAGWEAVANWSTVAEATTPDPAAIPGAADDVIFNIDPVDAAVTVGLNGAQSANSLTFNNTGTTSLQGGGANRTLAIGAGGIVMDAAAGAATIGSGTANQNVAVSLTATQTWTNNSTTAALSIANPFTAGAGIGLTKAGAGDVAMTNALNTTNIGGVLNVQAGRLLMSGDITAGGLTGAGTLAVAGAASKWFFVNNPADSDFSGSLQNASATVRLGLVKRGIGTLTLSGTNTLGDNLGVENGLIKITGSTTAGVGGANGTASVGTVGNQNGRILIDGGTLAATKNTSPSVAIATAANSQGFLKMTTGSITTTSEFHIGRGQTGSFSAYTQTGGTLTSGNWLVVGLNNDRAVLNQSGGSITVSTNRMTIGAGGNASIGVANLSGGTFTSVAGTNTGVFVGENGTGTLNVSGTANVSLATNGGATSGTLQFGGNAVSLAGNVNLLGGSISAFAVTKGASTAGAVYRMNFNGGTLKAAMANPGFFADLANTEAYVYGGGGTVDNGGNAITISEPLLAPVGNGVSATGLTVSGGGYQDTPLVTITGGGGTGATAVATIDASGNLTGIEITNPGINYISAPTFALLGGGVGNTGALGGAATLVPNASGGMTFTGAGATRVGGTNTFTGPIAVNQGKLGIAQTLVNAVSVASGATLEVWDPIGSPSILEVPTLNLANGSRVDLDVSAFSGLNDTITVSNVSGLTLGTASIGLYDDGTTNALTTAGVYTLFNYSGTLNGGTAGLTVANPVSGYNYAFSAVSGQVKVTITFTDTDGDLMPDIWETANGLNPNDPSDATGTITYPPTPSPFNTDGDFTTNLEEFQAGTNPNSATSDGFNTDNDLLLDSWEVSNFGNITARDGTGDYDGDLATDAAEFYASTNVKGASPLSAADWPDADLDQLNDAWEVTHFTNITAKDGSADSDGDGFSDLQEFQALSNPGDAAWTPAKAQIIHRWDFNGDLDDSISGVTGVTNSPAEIVDPNGETASSAVTLGTTDVLLTGGASATSDYVKLGSNLLNGRSTPVTIEVWATQVTVQNWARMFDFGSAETENFFASWTQGTTLASSRQEWRDVVTSTSNVTSGFTLNKEYHVVFTFEPGAGFLGTNKVTYYAAPALAAELGTPLGTFDTANNLVNFTDTLDALGRSSYAGDNVANARYNDVRIWHGALTGDEREKLHDAGADSLNTADTDADGLVDAWEIANFGSIAATTGAADSDGDGFTNAEEQDARSNPNSNASKPDNTDGDTLSDAWEVANFTSLDQLPNGDPDGDLATNEEEETAGTNPNNAASWPDTDGDLLKDAWEVLYFGDLDIDNDSNNANDGNADFDGDGATDAAEFAAGTNPVLAGSLPPVIVDLPATGTDAASDISSTKTYTHALDFGATIVPVTLNGVSFHQTNVPPTGNDAAGTDNDRWDSTDTTGGRSGVFTMTKSLANDWPQNTNGQAAGADGEMFNLLTDFSHINGSVVGSTQTITLGGLVPGTRYSTRLYYRPWGLAGNRSTTLIFNGEGYNVTYTMNPDQSAIASAHYVKFDFTANDSDLTLTFSVNSAGNSWHQYALTNEVVPAGDSDLDNLPDAWEIANFGNVTSQNATGDAEGDGTDNRTEYLLGLSPVNGTQRFAAKESNATPGSGVTLTWPAQNGLTFTVWRSTNLGAWTQIGGTITASGTTASYTDNTAPVGKSFYRVTLTTP